MTATQPNRQEAFARAIKAWDIDHLGRCLIAPDVSDVAKEAVRAELIGRGVNVEEATARATAEAAEGEAKKTPLTFKERLVLWGPTTVIVVGLAIGLYVFSR